MELCGNISLAFAVLFTSLVLVEGAKWSYSGKAGPVFWHELFPDQCSGTKQSPIDIRAEQTIYDPTLKDFAIWYDPPKPDSNMFVKNNGHALQVDLVGDFFVTNGGLPHVYKAAQFHFHWGHKAHHGSEHLMEGKASPIEMHVVTYDSDLYNTIGDAVQQKDGLAVLGVMFEISEEDNPAFETIVKAIKHVRDPEKHVAIKLPHGSVSIRDVLPADITRYFRYSGSLTTPHCFESVVWTVFEQKQTISRAQLKEFRSLLQPKRHHHHHHKHENSKADGDSGVKAANKRSKRSLNAQERRQERQAMDVLTELGIKGNLKQEAYLREATLKHNERLQADQPALDTTVNEVATDIKTEEAHLKKVEPARDILVNNFRPVQPLNSRIVRRSFRLREDPARIRAATATGERAVYAVVEATNKNDKADCNGGTELLASVVLLLASLLMSKTFL